MRRTPLGEFASMRRSAVAYAAGFALALAACGGEDSASDGAETRESERRWADRVNSACREHDAAARRLVRQLMSEGLRGTELVAETLERSAPQTRRQLSDLRSITAPAALRSEYHRFLDRLEDSLPLIERLARVARTNRRDPGLNNRLQRVAEDTRPFARRHGLTDCL